MPIYRPNKQADGEVLWVNEADPNDKKNSIAELTNGDSYYWIDSNTQVDVITKSVETGGIINLGVVPN